MTLVGDVVRAESRIKSLYRSRGILVCGVNVYPENPGSVTLSASETAFSRIQGEDDICRVHFGFQMPNYKGKLRVRSFLVILLMIPTIVCGGCSNQTQPIDKELVLLTPEEATRLRLTDEEWEQEFGLIPVLPKDPLKGPNILIKRPKINHASTSIETISPIDFLISFEENLAPVDMDSLRIIAKKGFFKKSLLGLLQPYISGTTIDVKAVDWPEGNFQIQIAIADSNGERTVQNFRLKVR